MKTKKSEPTFVVRLTNTEMSNIALMMGMAAGINHARMEKAKDKKEKSARKRMDKTIGKTIFDVISKFDKASQNKE